MAKKMIGIEIGSDSLKLAVCSGTDITDMAIEKLPENLVRDGRVAAPAALSELIRSVCKKNGIRPGPCALVIPGKAVISHHVTVPIMGEKELELNLPFEFRDFVGKDGDKYLYDYSIIRVGDASMDLYASAVPKEAMDKYYSIMKKAGLKLKVAIPAELAWMNLIQLAKNEPKNICIIDIGHYTTRVDIFSDGNFVMGKEIELGGQLIDKAIADTYRIDPYVARARKEANLENVLSDDNVYDAYNSIALEVMKIINYYNYTNPDKSSALRDIYYCGGSAHIEQLRTVILKNTDLTLHNIRRLARLADDESDLPLYCTLAAGAAIQQ